MTRRARKHKFLVRREMRRKLYRRWFNSLSTHDRAVVEVERLIEKSMPYLPAQALYDAVICGDWSSASRWLGLPDISYLLQPKTVLFNPNTMVMEGAAMFYKGNPND